MVVMDACTREVVGHELLRSCGAAEALLDPAARDVRSLVVDGVDYHDPDERLAATGLNDLARRTGAAILVLP